MRGVEYMYICGTALSVLMRFGRLYIVSMREYSGGFYVFPLDVFRTICLRNRTSYSCAIY